jgi:hypothetical protein
MRPRRIKLVGNVIDMRELRNACKILAGKPEGKKWPLGRLILLDAFLLLFIGL